MTRKRTFAMTDDRRQASLLTASLLRRCPRCGEGALYERYLTLRKCCAVCGLDLTKADSGDGPSVFVIFIVGAVTGAFTLWVMFVFDPPMWVFAILLIGLVLGLSLALLPVAKAAMVALQYRTQAGEGRLDQE